MKISEIYSAYNSSSGVATDTRKLGQGQIFFALKGENFDGNKYAQSALDQGCSYVIIDDPEVVDANEPRAIVVEDVLTTLQDLARFHRSKLKIPVIGLTGSNGKTTSKELLAAALSIKYITYATKGNLNNHIGVPLSILDIKEEHEIAIIEMGANHQKEIGFLCTISHPDVGYITNIGLAHLEGFGGEKGVYIGKKELFDYIRNNEGKMFVNLDDEKVTRASEGYKSITYGQNKNALYQGEFSLQNDLLKVKWFRDNDPRNQFEIQTQLTGAYNFQNVMSAVAVSRFFGVSPLEISEGISNYIPTNNRSQIELTKKGNKVIVDCYNANPNSMAASIENLQLMKAQEKFVMLGDMLEIGDLSISEHKKVLAQLQQTGIKNIYLVGEYFSEAAKEMPYENIKVFNKTNDLKTHVDQNTIKGATILLKGSRKMKLEQMLELL